MVALENIFLALSIVIFVVTSGYILYTYRPREAFVEKRRSPSPALKPSSRASPAPSPLAAAVYVEAIPSQSAQTAPVFVTPSMSESVKLPTTNKSYEEVTAPPAPAPSTPFQSTNPPYVDKDKEKEKEKEKDLTTSLTSSKVAEVNTGFFEKSLPPSASTTALENAKPYQDISSTPAPIVEVPESPASKITKENGCVQQYFGSCLQKDALLEIKDFVVITTSENDEIFFAIPKELASIYQTGIELTRGAYNTTVKNKKLSFPYTITKVSSPKNYSVYFKKIAVGTDAISINDSIQSGKEYVLTEPILVDPNVYASIQMFIIPS